MNDKWTWPQRIFTTGVLLIMFGAFSGLILLICGWYKTAVWTAIICAVGLIIAELFRKAPTVRGMK